MLEFSLRQLEVFVAAAEYNSFTRAAETLYLTQSTVSTHIQGLERALGAELFRRDVRKKMVLTEEGRRVYLAARDILARCGALRGDGAEKSPPVLTIAASTVPAQCILPELMSAFVRREPGCRFLLRRGDTAQVHGMLERGEAQAGFVGAKLDETAFSYHPVRRDRLVLVTPDEPRFHGPVPDPAELLLREPVIAREESSGTWKSTEAWLRGRGIPPQRLHLLARMEAPEAIRRAVIGGMGVSVLSSLAAEEDVAAGRLLRFDLEEGGVWRELYLTVPRQAPPDGLRDAFVTFALQNAAERRDREESFHKRED